LVPVASAVCSAPLHQHLAPLDLGPKLREERGLQRRLAAVEQTAAAAELENDAKDKKEAGQ
jgi:hypothetical protein